MSSSNTNDADGTNDSNNNNNNSIMQLELTGEVKQQEIVTSYVFDAEIDSLSIELNHKYSKKKITSPIEFNWPRTIDTLIKELKRKKINANHITMPCDVADNAGEKILKWRQNKQAEKENEDNHPGSTSQKLLSLAKQQCEELFVDQYGEPYAAVKIREHLETVNLNHTRFRNWICKAYYELEDSVPNSESITNALNILKANAEFEGRNRIYVSVIIHQKKMRLERQFFMT